MADYAKLTLDAVLSENSDYSDPRSKLKTTQTLTPSAHVHQKINVLTTGNTLLDFIPYNFASVDLVLIQNLDTTNHITVSWLAHPQVSEAISNPGSTGFTFSSSAATITDNTSGSKFANAAAGLYLHTGNATTSANNGNRLIIEKVSAHVVKVATALTDSSNDTAVSFTLNAYNQQRVGPGGFLTIPGNLLTDTVTATFNEMQLVADTKTVACNVIMWGT